ncbi:MAG: exodeoxyribonuclease V subunit beta [Desulfobacteraceae bacterium]|nr:MAG: exodeoxyribonuclease V subunit beta [Desulfobacteraceae bacterium]
MKKFDLVNAPLFGATLIEAGAGTGKTYAIESLFLRLIIEKKLTVDQILVVTFTKAATEELKGRIRNKLINAKDTFKYGTNNDSLIYSLYEKYEDHALAGELINKALIDFNEAAIFTIHGFCARILSEYSFETGTLFDTELVTDQADLMQEVAEDFWRISLYEAAPEFISYSAKKLKGPEYFLKLLSRQVSSCKKIIPCIEKPSFEKLLYDYRIFIQRVRSIWSVSKDEIAQLMHDPAIKGNIYGKTEAASDGISGRDIKISALFSGMERFLNGRSVGFPLFDRFEYFTAEKINNSIKIKHKAPSHPLFDMCDMVLKSSRDIAAEFEKNILYLKREFIKYADTELKKRKKNRNIQYYEDLLTKVRDTLVSGSTGNDLSFRIRRKYMAALIDEFQDTDPVQYEIFSNLFDSEASVLFIIGDPKQAIYSFRGADIFSYMKAAARTGSKNTLTENWRSDPCLVDAVNAIFSFAEKPFVFDEISFTKGISGLKETRVDPDLSYAELTLWHMFSERYAANDKSLPIKEAEEIISESVASEVLRLTNTGDGEAKKGFREGDIAILVRTNDQARTVKESLLKRKIPSVIYSHENVFDSGEAAQLERVLAAVSDPSNVKSVRAALVTDIIGVTGGDIDSACQDPLLWDRLQAVFIECSHIWTRYGFIKMFRHFMKMEKVKERLVRFHDGERRVTNLLHLSEILHRASTEKNLGITGLLRWFSEQRDISGERLEEHLLRLESDDEAVKIVTMHKSKGLEFPVVFCPFNWGGSAVRGDEILFHDEGKERNPVLDLGRDERSVMSAGKELLSENIRLLYVSLTRAKKKCYLVWGRINSAETSAMAYLFHYARNRKSSGDDDIIKSLKDNMAGKKNEDLIDDLDDLVIKGKGSIGLSVLPPPDDIKYDIPEENAERLFCRNFTGKIDDTFRISSYSSIAARTSATHDIKDVDAGAVETYKDAKDLQEFSEKPDIFSFPRGARPGTFFHDLFESMDYSGPEAALREKLVAGKLAEYGFGGIWKMPVCDMIEKVLAVLLNAEGMTLKLSDIERKNRVNEMEFYFPLKTITPHTIKKVFGGLRGIKAGSDPDWTDNLLFAPAKGFMKGYMDMVFYHEGKFFLVDWKSNYLGTGLEYYGRNSLYETMERESYILQYHLYTLALHQYLKLKNTGYTYKDSFGGIFYIFIRGVDDSKSPGSGIYYDLPDISFIDRLGKVLIPGY